jgi:hypothetical protein
MSNQKTYKEFKQFMMVDCGMPVTADRLVECCECREASYPSDFSGHDWQTCPVCGYDWVNDNYPNDDEEEEEEHFWDTSEDEEI